MSLKVVMCQSFVYTRELFAIAASLKPFIKFTHLFNNLHCSFLCFMEFNYYTYSLQKCSVFVALQGLIIIKFIVNTYHSSQMSVSWKLSVNMGVVCVLTSSHNLLPP